MNVHDWESRNLLMSQSSHRTDQKSLKTAIIPHHILQQTVIYVTSCAVIFIITSMDFRIFITFLEEVHTKKHTIVKTQWLKTKTSSDHNAW